MLNLINSIGNQYSSSFLHIIGGFVGLIIGTIFIFKKWVDPEGWDFYTLYFNKKSPEKKTKASSKQESSLKQDDVAKINRSIQLKDAEEAIVIYKQNVDLQSSSNFNHVGFFRLLLEKEKYSSIIALSEHAITDSQKDYNAIQIIAAKAVDKSVKSEAKMREILQRIDPANLAFSDKETYQLLQTKYKIKQDKPEDPLSLEPL